MVKEYGFVWFVPVAPFLNDAYFSNKNRFEYRIY